VSFRRAVVENWPYKIAAIVLSILLWLNVSAGEERQDQPVATRIEFEVQDSAWSLRDAPREVTTFFTGPRGQMVALFNDVFIRKVIGPVDDSAVVVDLSIDDVVYDRALNVRPTAVAPARVEITLEPSRRKVVAVRADVDVRADPGFVIDRIQVDPDSVTVYGPSSRLGSITHLDTELFDAGQIRRSTSRQVALLLPGAATGLEIVPASVLVAVEVDSILTRRFRVSVSAMGSAAGVTLTPPLVEIVVTGSAASVQSLTPTDLRATILIDRALVEPRSFEVSVRLPEGVTATAVPNPPRVTASPGVGPDPGGRE